MDLVAIVMEIYGLLFLIVWCGVFGRKEIVGVLKTMSVQCLISSFYFSKPYWTGSQCGETNLFLQFWIYLIYVIFVFDMYTPVYSLCIWVSLFFISINLYYLSKKKKKMLFDGSQCYSFINSFFPSLKMFFQKKNSFLLGKGEILLHF